MTRGGARPGAGRPKGQGRFGVETKPVRVPTLLANKILNYADNNGYTLPLYTTHVPAGCPFLADDHVDEYVSIAEFMIPHPKSSYLVQVKGDSMIKAGIFEGDILVVDSQEEVRSGQIVLASIDGDVTVKRYVKQDGVQRLLPENDAYKPIDISQHVDFRICGVVIRSIRRL